jgi:hypothetical protein
MTDFIVFPGIDGNNVFAPEIRQAIADSPELRAAFAPSDGSENYASALTVMALLASKMNASAKGTPNGVAGLDASSKLLESNIPDRLSEAAQRASLVTKWQPRTFYPVESGVLNSDGDVVTAKSAHTSDDEYNPAYWKLAPVDGGSP